MCHFEMVFQIKYKSYECDYRPIQYRAGYIVAIDCMFQTVADGSAFNWTANNVLLI